MTFVLNYSRIKLHPGSYIDITQSQGNVETEKKNHENWINTKNVVSRDYGMGVMNWMPVSGGKIRNISVKDWFNHPSYLFCGLLYQHGNGVDVPGDPVR